MTVEIRTAQDRRDAVEKEYGVYVALDDIVIDGVRAFNQGDPVPVSHVTGGLVPASAVAKTTTKTGQAALADAGIPPA